MVFKKKQKGINFKDNSIQEPNVDYYLHLIFETGIRAPTDSLENSTPLSNAWTVVEMCAYQAEVFGWVKNLVDPRKSDSDYTKIVEEEKKRLEPLTKDAQILNAKIAYFKLAFILRAYEGLRPDLDEGDIPSGFLKGEKEEDEEIGEEEGEKTEEPEL